MSNVCVVIEEQATSTVRTEAVLAWFRQNKEDMKARRRGAVERMIDMTDVEVGIMYTSLKKILEKPDLVDRMMACATRNIPQAEHLYDLTRVLSHAQILDASTKALEQVANPNSEFPYITDEGKLVVIKARDLAGLGSARVPNIWDRKTGRISTDKQRERLKREIDNRVVRARGTYKHIVSAAAVREQDGADCLDIECEDGSVSRFNIKELRAILR